MCISALDFFMMAMVIALCCKMLEAKVLPSLGRYAFEGVLLSDHSRPFFFSPLIMLKMKEKRLGSSLQHGSNSNKIVK